ncbi:hypothetical protein [Aliikangiella sp. IMCC44359]|uniref:hypothetical protein n=1 Tax=Aliikangiella sp. IMCC44359 TaxID=3459125 RepID=UPI00403A95AF
MLNDYKSKRHRHIEKLKKIPLINITNHRGNEASWEDDGWVFTNSDGLKSRYWFVNPTTCRKPSHKMDFSDSQKLDSESKLLLMAYSIDINCRPLSLTSKSSKNRAARLFLSNFKEDISGISSVDIASLKKNLEDKIQAEINQFLLWCQQKEFISEAVSIPINKNTGRTSYSEDIEQRAKKNLPDERALMALGAIFNEVIPKDINSIEIDYYSVKKHAFTVTMSALAMASPNRVAAEQTLLTKQTLKNWKRDTSKGDTATVYYLDWPGSKGYQDNRNHILSILNEYVSRAIKYFNVICEPGRVLARFYSAPQKPLRFLLGSFKANKKLMEIVDDEKPTNILMLGFLLGFYDDSRGDIFVTEDTNNSKKIQLSPSKYIFLKNVIDLTPLDKIQLLPVRTRTLLGTHLPKESIEKIFGSQEITVYDFQSRWISYLKDKLSTFPKSFSYTGTNHITFDKALFCFTGKQFCKTSSLGPAMSSYYALVPVSTTANFFAEHVSGTSVRTTIFEEFGFDPKIKIKPNQFRHWLNNTADKSKIPHRIITMWSGRKDQEQTLVYTHSSDDEKGGNVCDILFPDAADSRSVRVATHEEYQTLMKLSATLTSTGFCTQDLNVSPCTYLNDFVSQCTLCAESCHVNRDIEAIDFLEKDLEIQVRRLEEVKNLPRFTSSDGMQKWFILHYRNTHILKNLIELMTCEDILEGSPIRYVSANSEFRVTNMQSKQVSRVALNLPDSKKALIVVLDELKNQSPRASSKLDNLLEKFGVNMEE